MDQSSGDWHLWSVSLELPWPLCWVGCLKTRAGSQAASPSPTSLPCCTSHRGCVLLVVTVGSPCPPALCVLGALSPFRAVTAVAFRCCPSLEPLSSSWLSGSTGLSLLRHTANVPGSVLPLVMCLFPHYLPVCLPLSLSHCVFKSVLYICGEEISLTLLVFLIFLILC